MTRTPLSTRVYHHLTKVYSRRFRREAGPELEAMFLEAYRDARRRGRVALIRLWLRTVADLVWSAIPERLGAGRKARRVIRKEREPMETVMQDIRYAVRTLRKSPGFVAVAVLSLALGIGANTTIFTVINAVFLQGLPVAEPARLANVYTADEGIVGGFIGNPVSIPNFQDLREQNDVFSGLATVAGFGATFSTGGDDEAAQITVQMVTGNYFEVVGVQAALGRVFSFGAAEDQAVGSRPEVVLSSSVWANRFGSDPSVIGTSVTLNSHPFTVIGVTPPGFKGLNALAAPEQVWIPINMFTQIVPPEFHRFFDSRRALASFPVGRLNPGVTIEQAEAAMRTIAARLQQEYPEANRDRTVRLASVADAAVGIDQRAQLLRGSAVLMTVVGLVLLIACVNLANLLLARGATRAKELSIRAALGAERHRLVRQLLTESMLIAVAGGVAGIVVAFWARDLLWALRPSFLQDDAISLALDTRVMLFTLGVSVATGLVFGMLPSIRASSTDLQDALNVGGRQESGGFGRGGLRQILVVSEVALTLVALIGAGLFLRSMRSAQRIDPGFETQNVFVAGVSPSSAGYDSTRSRQYFDEVLERVGSLPGVQSVAIASNFPLGGTFQQTVVLEGEDPSQSRMMSNTTIVSLDYFNAMDIPLVRGRLFTELDRRDTRPVAVINQAMASRYWPGDDALGKRFRFIAGPTTFEVVGIVRDVAVIQVGEAPQPLAYTPLEQQSTAFAAVHVRTAGDPHDAMASIQQAIREVERQIALINPTTVGDMIGQALWPRRMAAGLLGFFGLLALGMASVGVYGVMSYTASQRRHEIGIRMAIGASATSILKMVLTDGLKVASVGLVVGLLASLLLARTVSSMLFGVSAADPITFGGISLLVVVVAAAASLVPAHRAMRVDPLAVLRSE